MGQKSNPIGLRLGITRGWDSIWFAKKKEYGKLLIEDYKIRDFIKRKGFVTKRQITDYLGWGVRIKFSGYRNALRKYDEIKFTKNGYEWRR